MATAGQTERCLRNVMSPLAMTPKWEWMPRVVRDHGRGERPRIRHARADRPSVSASPAIQRGRVPEHDLVRRMRRKTRTVGVHEREPTERAPHLQLIRVLGRDQEVALTGTTGDHLLEHAGSSPRQSRPTHTRSGASIPKRRLFPGRGACNAPRASPAHPPGFARTDHSMRPGAFQLANLSGPRMVRKSRQSAGNARSLAVANPAERPFASLWRPALPGPSRPL